MPPRPGFISLHLRGPIKALGGLRPGQGPPEGGEGMPGGPAPNGVFWHRQQGLLQVLKAYTLYRPEQGYCQAQGPVAAVLLMYLPPEVSALNPATGTQDPDPLTPVMHDPQRW